MDCVIFVAQMMHNTDSVKTTRAFHTQIIVSFCLAQVLETKGNSFASDVYSFRIVAWEVITRQLPWADQPLDRDIFVRVVMCEGRSTIPAD